MKEKKTITARLMEYFRNTPEEQLEKNLELLKKFNRSDISVDEFLNSQEKKLNLKPFDIQKAREGKPVCTRDGRKARIICFDLQSIEKTPIVAAVQVTDKQEVISHYYEDGRQFVDGISELDLMMLPEKKEGWINMYALNTCYSSKEEAEANIDQDYEHEYVRTVRIEWEE